MTQGWDFVDDYILWGSEHPDFRTKGEVLGWSIDDIDWCNWGASTRGRINNFCKHQIPAIRSVGQLVKLSEHDLMLSPNIGPQSVDAIKQFLEFHRLKLRNDGR